MSTDGTFGKPPHAETLRLQDAFRVGLNFADRADFDDARRGFIGTIPDAQVLNARGAVVSSMAKLAFLDQEEAPGSVNPSLWRLARLNTNHGLFQVTEPRLLKPLGHASGLFHFPVPHTGRHVLCFGSVLIELPTPNHLVQNTSA